MNSREQTDAQKNSEESLKAFNWRNAKRVISSALWRLRLFEPLRRRGMNSRSTDRTTLTPKDRGCSQSPSVPPVKFLNKTRNKFRQAPAAPLNLTKTESERVSRDRLGAVCSIWKLIRAPRRAWHAAQRLEKGLREHQGSGAHLKNIKE